VSLVEFVFVSVIGQICQITQVNFIDDWIFLKSCSCSPIAQYCLHERKRRNGCRISAQNARAEWYHCDERQAAQLLALAFRKPAFWPD
jgi:hypothetical protein